MCAIAGLVSKKPLESEDLVCFLSIVERQVNRGPDQKKILKFQNAVMAVNRLIIRHEKSGVQPYLSEDGTIAVCLNGEIYNYEELCQEFSNVKLISELSEVRLIYLLYQKYGIKFVGKIRGMFAISIIDLNNDKLFLFRDFFGEKPLYYSMINGRFIFASELKAVLDNNFASVEINQKFLKEYLKLGFVREPNIIIKGIKKVPRSGILELNLITLEHSCTNYEPFTNLDTSKASSEHSCELDRKITKCILEKITENVESGLGFSSGLDSLAIALCGFKYQTEMTAITVDFPGSHLSETEVALTKAKRLNMKAVRTNLTPPEAAELYSFVTYLRDEPIADISGPAIYALFKAARENNLKVVHVGCGGDELFWGYDWGIRNLLNANIQNEALNLPSKSKALKLILRVRSFPTNRKLEQIKWTLGLGGIIQNLIHFLRGYKSGVNIDELAFREPLSDRKIRKYLKIENPSVAGIKKDPKYLFDLPSVAMDCLLDTYLITNGLQQFDRLAGYFGLEARNPFLDTELLKLVKEHSIAGNEINEEFKSKGYLRNFLSREFKEFRELISYKKLGFTPPVRDWYVAIYYLHKQVLAHTRLVELGLANKRIHKFLRRPLTYSRLPKKGWLELLTLELWIREIERTGVRIESIRS